MGEKVMYEIAKRLQEKGFEIKVVTTGDSNIKSYDGIETVRLPIHRYAMNFAALQILEHAKDCDLIQTSNYNACFPSFVAAKMLNKPIVCLVQGMYGSRWTLMRGPVFGRVSMLVEKLQIDHGYDKFVFFSEYGRKAALEAGVERERTKVIKPGFDHRKFKSRKKEPYVLFVGRLAKQKGVDCLIEAARGLPGIQFKIVGSGEEEERLKAAAPENVEFLGYLKDKELADVYSKALVFCLPSIGETLGFVLLEAMASGCAIVSTVPFDFEGAAVKMGNARQLRNAIENMINNPRAAVKMGRKNMVKARGYSWDSFIEELVKIYKSLLKS